MQQSPPAASRGFPQSCQQKAGLFFTAVLPAASLCKIKSSDKSNIWFNLLGIYDANVQTWLDCNDWIYI